MDELTKIKKNIEAAESEFKTTDLARKKVLEKQITEWKTTLRELEKTTLKTTKTTKTT